MDKKLEKERPGETGTDGIGLGENKSEEVRSAKVRMDEVRSDEVRSDEVRSDEVRSDEIKDAEAVLDGARGDEEKQDAAKAEKTGEMVKARKNRPAEKWSVSMTVGAVLAGGILLMVIVGIFILPYDPETMNLELKFAGISLAHPFGCDNYGRDIFTRVMVGARTTLLVALGTVGIGAGAGIIIGALTGYFGGWIDEAVMRVMDALFAFPSILLALLVVSLLGSGKYRVILALGIAFIPSFARVVRGQFLQARELEYVKNARIMGCSNLRIIFVHILPNTLSVLVPTVMIGFNNAVLAEAGMSYLGIGVQPPDASLGRMLSEAQSYLFTQPSYALFTGAVIILLVLGFSLLADGLKKR